MDVAPVGYCNKITESGKESIAFREPEATLLRQAFNEISESVLAVELVRKKCIRKGLKGKECAFL